MRKGGVRTAPPGTVHMCTACLWACMPVFIEGKQVSSSTHRTGYKCAEGCMGLKSFQLPFVTSLQVTLA